MDDDPEQVEEPADGAGSQELEDLRQRLDRLLGADGASGQIWERLGGLTSSQASLDATVKDLKQAIDDAALARANLGEQLDRLDSGVSALSRPIWRRPSFLGGFSAVGLALALYILPPIWMQDDPAFPRFVHASILHTDKALASGLALDSAQADPSQQPLTPLYPAMKRVLQSMVGKDQEARAALAELVRSKQRDFFHGSVAIFQREIVTKPVSCRILSDPFLFEVVARYSEPSDVLAWCETAEASISIPFYEPVSLKIPFSAKEGDVANVRVSLSETVNGANDQPEQRPVNPKSNLILFVGDSESVDLPAHNAEFESVFPVPITGAHKRRSVTLTLSPAGQEMVEAGSYLTISAVVEVARN